LSSAKRTYVNHLEANLPLACIVIGLSCLGFALMAFTAWALLTHFQVHKEEQQLNRDFTRDMKHATAAPWDGETYEWTPETMAFLADQTAPEYQPDAYGYPADLGYGPAAPVPASSISGPLPVITGPAEDAPADDEQYIAWMRAWTDNFLASQGVEQL
jgi:hypothetical protein